MVNGDGAWIVDGVVQTQAASGAGGGSSAAAYAPSKETIDRYGYQVDGSSILSFHILEGSLVDLGNCYQVDAIYQYPVSVPGNLKPGDRVRVVFNEMTGESKELVYRDGGLYEVGVLYACEYYYTPTEDGSPVILYVASDDRVDKPVCQGRLYIRKDATDEIAINHSVRPVTPESLNRENWFNGVYFDENGYVTRLVFYGD